MVKGWGASHTPSNDSDVRVQSYKFAPLPSIHTHFRCHWRAQVVTCALDQLAIIRVPTASSLGLINLLVGHRRQRNFLLNRSLVYYKRMDLGNSKREEMHRDSMSSPGATLPKPPCIHQPRSFPSHILLGFYGGFMTKV